MALAEAEKERQQALERERTAFLDMAAHQLYTPLTPLLIDLRLLEKSLDEVSDARVREVLARIQRNAGRLRRIVHDVADAAYVGEHVGQRDATIMDLARVAGEVTEACRLEAAQQRIRLEVKASEAVPACGDQAAIEHVTYQLVNNAIQFTPAGGHVRVHVSREAEERAVMTVRDNGLGLSKEQREQVFGPFIQPHDPLHGRAGAGLGLFVSRLIVHAHGGTLRAEPASGRGSAFTLTLPLAAPMRGRVLAPADRR